VIDKKSKTDSWELLAQR